MSVLTEVKQNKTVMLVVGIIVVITILAVIAALYKNWKKGTAAAGQIASRPAIQQLTGVDAKRQLICEQVAEECRGAIGYLGGWIGGGLNWIAYIYDRELTQALNRLNTPEEAAYTSQHYRTLANGRSLLAAVNDGTYTEKEQIKPQIRLNLS